MTNRVLRQPHLHQAQSLGSPESRLKGMGHIGLRVGGVGGGGPNLLSVSLPQGFWACFLSASLWTLKWLGLPLLTSLGPLNICGPPDKEPTLNFVPPLQLVSDPP